jgi:hypothetical protein
MKTRNAMDNYGNPAIVEMVGAINVAKDTLVLASALAKKILPVLKAGGIPTLNLSACAEHAGQDFLAVVLDSEGKTQFRICSWMTRSWETYRSLGPVVVTGRGTPWEEGAQRVAQTVWTLTVDGDNKMLSPFDVGRYGGTLNSLNFVLSKGEEVEGVLTEDGFIPGEETKTIPVFGDIGLVPPMVVPSRNEGTGYKVPDNIQNISDLE